jgi:hypothetical protein
MRSPVMLRAMTILAALLVAPAVARAEQIVLFDITYTHDASNDAHHGISGAALNQPANWTAPINYAQGTIHFYQEVMTKPSDKDTIIDFCLISVRDYGCIETFIYKTVGLHETVRSMAGRDVDKRNVIDFTQKMRSIQMVLKTPAPTYINGGRPQSDFLPSRMRFVATLVSPGGTYVRPTPTPGFDPGPAARDAGAPPPGNDAGATPDAAVAMDAEAIADAPVVVDVPVTTPVVDAATSTPPTGPAGPSPDAAGKPPSNPGPTPGPGPAPSPSSPVAGGCSIGGAAAPTGLFLVGLLAAPALAARSILRRRRARRPRSGRQVHDRASALEIDGQ